jgi:hypothetical protein
MNLPDCLNKKFPGQKRVRLGTVVEPLRNGKTIPKGTFVVMASGDRKIRVKILEKDTPFLGSASFEQCGDSAKNHSEVFVMVLVA